MEGHGPDAARGRHGETRAAPDGSFPPWWWAFADTLPALRPPSGTSAAARAGASTLNRHAFEVARHHVKGTTKTPRGQDIEPTYRRHKHARAPSQSGYTCGESIRLFKAGMSAACRQLVLFPNFCSKLSHIPSIMRTLALIFAYFPPFLRVRHENQPYHTTVYHCTTKNRISAPCGIRQNECYPTFHAAGTAKGHP